MPRIPRGLGGGGVAHVLNRGNGRATVFHSAAEYEDFLGLLDRARKKHDVALLAFCLMPNHFHLVARVESAEDLSGLMQSWLTSHVRRQHKRQGSSGHLWQGRFKSFPIQEDQHLLTALRYVLMNPVRAGLVTSPWHWEWNSLGRTGLLSPWPVTPPVDMAQWLEGGKPDEDEAVRSSIRRGIPFGDEGWQQAAIREWGLEATLRPPGRPRKPACLESSRELQLSL